MPTRGPTVTEAYTIAWWAKDGAWHIALPYKPTVQDRENYPVSYPKGDPGPFYRWTEDSFPTRDAAIAKAEGGE